MMTEQPNTPTGSDGDNSGAEDIAEVQPDDYPQVEAQDDDTPAEPVSSDADR